jgi:porphobilinogen synthase
MMIRPRRNRKTENIRRIVRENRLSTDHLIAPLFVVEGEGVKDPIPSMPGQFRMSIDNLLLEIEQLQELGIGCVSLFPAIEDSLKDDVATESYNPDGLFPRAIAAVKEKFPQMLVMSDVAMDPYSSDGHDGLLDPSGEILNDATLEVLARMAVTQAAAGSDIIGPSDMMDMRVEYIRNALDSNGFENVSILSYTAKYASAFYGPFRDALDSAPKNGDKKTYQMDPSNVREALRELELDEMEGADMVMVKPGLPYLDVVRALKQKTHLPVAVYNVSGEYAMVKAAAEKGWLDEKAAAMEMLTSFVRAGADVILTYFAKDAATWLSEDS